MADLGNLTVRLSAETSQFVADMGKAAYQAQRTASNIERSFDSLKNILGGAIAVGGVTVFIKSLIDAADKLNDLSERTGISVERLSELQYAAKLSGTDIDKLQTAFSKLAVKATEAATGNKEAADVFDALGISVKDAGGELKQAEALFTEVAGAIGSIQNPTVRAALAVEIFGKSGMELVPLLTNLKGLTAEAQNLGIVMSGDLASSAAEFNDNLDRMSFLTSAAARSLVGEFLPAINATLEGFIKARAEGSGFFGVLGALSTSGSQMKNPGAAIADINDKLESLRKTREGLENARFRDLNEVIFGDIADIDRQTKYLTAQRETLKALQQKQVLANQPKDGYQDQVSRMQQRAEASKFDVNKLGADAKKARETLDKEADAVQAARQKLLGLRDASEVERVGLDVQSGKFKDYSTKTKAELLSLAGAYDELKNSLERAKIANKEFDDIEQSLRGGEKVVEGFIERNRELNESIRLTKILQQGGMLSDNTFVTNINGDRIALQRESAMLTDVQRDKLTRLFDLNRQYADALKQVNALETPENVIYMTKVREDLTRAYERQAGVIEQLAKEQQAANDSFVFGAQQAFGEYAVTSANFAGQVKDAFLNAFKGMEDAIVNFTLTGKLSFTDMARSIIADIARIYVRQQIIQPLLNSASGMFGGLFGNVGTSMRYGTNIGSQQTSMLAAQDMGLFANGGIMTSKGIVNLRRYASGGIANSPQLAMFGEGSKPEAYVPLPDGRSIPVTMSGGSASTNVVVNVNVENGNVSNMGSGDASQLGKVIAGVVQAELIKQKRNGGLLAA